MIVGCCFEGDTHQRAKMVQHDMYPRNVALIFEEARVALEEAEARARVTTVIGSILEPRERLALDHRVLQDAHDLIAAQFRWQESQGDFLQQRSYESDRSYDLRVAGVWHVFYLDELRKLVKVREFVHAVLEAVGLDHTEIGVAAQRRLGDLLRVRYAAWWKPAAPRKPAPMALRQAT